jgi:hypothetical protein
MYTQQATGLLRENANNDPQGLSSLLGSFVREGQQQQGDIGNLFGDLLGGGGSGGDNQNPSQQQQQQKKKGGGLGDMLG